MRSITVEEKYDNYRLNKFLKKMFPHLPDSALYKALRKKDIKINGVRVNDGKYRVSAGDILELFISDDVMEGRIVSNNEIKFKTFSIVYEDNNIIIVNKAQGIPVHPDKEEKHTLIDMLKEYLDFKGEENNSISLCHRIDRNTGGLVILAKNKAALSIILDKIRKGEIKKYYTCVVKGTPENKSAILEDYFYKDEYKSKVMLSKEYKKGYCKIKTKYKVIKTNGKISLLNVELITGKTHQIRAHLAFIGHPIIGDGKYGENKINREYGYKKQLLWAYKLKFDFKTDTGIFNYLRGRTFEIVPPVPQDLFSNTL